MRARHVLLALPLTLCAAAGEPPKPVPKLCKQWKTEVLVTGPENRSAGLKSG